MESGAVDWHQLGRAARDDVAAAAREASQLAESAAELAAAQVLTAQSIVDDLN